MHVELLYFRECLIEFPIVSVLPVTTFSGHISSIINTFHFCLFYNPSLSHLCTLFLPSFYLIMVTYLFRSVLFLHQLKVRKSFLKLSLGWCFSSLFMHLFHCLCYLFFMLTHPGMKINLLRPNICEHIACAACSWSCSICTRYKFSGPHLEGRMTCSSSISVSNRNVTDVALCIEIGSSLPPTA